MASLTAFLHTAARFWYFPAAALLVLALLGYGCAYFRALRPRDGTLEWITAHDRPRLRLQAVCHRLSRRDALGLAGVVLLTAAVWGSAALRIMLPSYGSLAAVPGQTLLTTLAYYCVLPALHVAVGYLLMKELCGSTAAAVLGSCVLGLNLLLIPPTALFATAAALFAHHFVARSEQASFAGNRLPLLLSTVLLTVGCYFDPSLCLFGAALLALSVAACVLRFVNLGRSDGYLRKLLLTVFLTVAATVLALYLPAALTAGLRFPMLFLTADYYLLIAQRLTALFSGLFLWQPAHVLTALAYDWPLLLTGFLAVLAAFVNLLRRRDGRGLTLTLLFLGAAAMHLTGGSYVLPAACALGLCYLWSGLLRRGRRGLVAAGAAILLAAEGAFYVLTWLLP